MREPNLDSPFESPWSGLRTWVFMISGVGLPLTALIVELSQRWSARAFFDPIPTIGHVLLVASVPVANFWAWRVMRRHYGGNIRRATWAVGFASGVALFYSVLFLPILPIAAIGIIYFGLGLLAWAPVTALICALLVRKGLVRKAKEEEVRVRAWPGVLLGAGLLIALELPETVTRYGARLATDDAAETRARGLSLLRSFGNEEVLLRMCYVRSGRATDIVSFILNFNRTMQIQASREVYYRVTGRAFNSVPPPRQANPWRARNSSWSDVDFGQGGDEVGGRIRNLFLASSQIDGSVSAEAAVGYLEWTMVFRNDSDVQREARTQIALPPGAVVSRVTLWVNGEEREAAFAGRSQVRAAYQAVVSQRRDPVLVTSAGADRISMQLFPVPPAGEMKVRLGMTFPLGLTTEREGVMRLPHFHERNFEIREEYLRHSVWIESKSKLSSALLPVGAYANSHRFQADLLDSVLPAAEASILVARPDQRVSWSVDSRNPFRLVRQVIQPDPVSRPGQLVIVVDGSASMRALAAQVAQVVARIPQDVDVLLVFAHDENASAAEALAMTGTQAASEIGSFDYQGGHDNTAALVRGLDIALARKDSVLLWIHGPQPVLLLQTEEKLLDRVVRGAALNQWLEWQIAPGANLIGERLDGRANIATLRGGDLEQIVSAWRSGRPRMRVNRESLVMALNSETVEAERGSDHLARLWAKGEIDRLIRVPPTNRTMALELATRYQLVTPVSGAVVLETQQQYDAAGLQPVPEGTVPTIPEPEEWALMLVALGVLIYAYRRRHAIFVARAA